MSRSKLKVAINGMGRIGRTILREWAQQVATSFDIVAVNNPGSLNHYLHLLKYDSTHGTFAHDVRQEGEGFYLNNHYIKFFSCKDPAEIPWGGAGVELVIDSTGKFRDKKKLGLHLRDTVRKVVLCAPGKDVDWTVVMGVNHENYRADQHHIISNASCTTNCLAPVAKILHEHWEIENGFMMTVHSYTSDQNLLDSSHEDLRRARAASVSMIPTSTGAAQCLGLVLPDLQGKIMGHSIRVPTPNVSVVDLYVNLKRRASRAEINNALWEASQGDLRGILGYSDLPLVSIDFNGAKESSVFDATQTDVSGSMVKVTAWYDNETGFSSRVIELVTYIGEKSAWP